MKIIIIGAVAAGAKVAAKTRRLLPDAKIDVYTDDTHVSYSSCGLPYFIQGNFTDYQTLLVRSPKEFEAQNIHIHLQNKVIKIYPDEKKILVKNLKTNSTFHTKFDKLVIATGAKPVIPDITNINAANIFTVRKIEDGIAIRNKALKSKHVTIIGSGYIGLEMLESFVSLGLKVTVLEYNKFIAPSFDNDISILILEQLNSINGGRFEILTSQLVTEIITDKNNNAIGLKTGSNIKINTDFIVLCTGVKPIVGIAREAGITIGETGAIKVNRHMQTNFPDIYACGDCAEKRLLINGAKIWLPLGSTANKEGDIAALNIAGIDDDFDGILASTVVRCLTFTMSKTGLTEKLAKKIGFDPISVIINKYDKVGFMPDVNNITLKLTADKTSGLLLGGQAIGAIGADKRINTLTSAILARLNVSEFMKNDLTYAPPYSPTIDPLLNAAKLLYKKLEN